MFSRFRLSNTGCDPIALLVTEDVNSELLLLLIAPLLEPITPLPLSMFDAEFGTTVPGAWLLAELELLFGEELNADWWFDRDDGGVTVAEVDPVGPECPRGPEFQLEFEFGLTLGCWLCCTFLFVGVVWLLEGRD